MGPHKYAVGDCCDAPSCSLKVIFSDQTTATNPRPSVRMDTRTYCTTLRRRAAADSSVPTLYNLLYLLVRLLYLLVRARSRAVNANEASLILPLENS
jgi:hypothetical protein